MTILNELHDLITEEIDVLSLGNDVSMQLSKKITEKLCLRYGGIPLYLPKLKRNKDLNPRNALMWSKFNGRNHHDLCREFNLSYQHVCKIIEQQRKKNQMDIFASN